MDLKECTFSSTRSADWCCILRNLRTKEVKDHKFFPVLSRSPLQNVFLTSHLQKTMRSIGAYLSAHLVHNAIVVFEEEHREGGGTGWVVVTPPTPLFLFIDLSRVFCDSSRSWANIHVAFGPNALVSDAQ